MNYLASIPIVLENFEGPLDFLWYLVQKEEIDIYEIRLAHITQQFLSQLQKVPSLNIDVFAEFVGVASCLIWLKSQKLLPKNECALEEEADPDQVLGGEQRLQIVQHLLDYSRFKEAAKELTVLEEKQSAFYSRGMHEINLKKKFGLENLTLDDLANLFKLVLDKTTPRSHFFKEDIWKVPDIIKEMRVALAKGGQIPFEIMFSIEKSREELIVTFLALLELMKMGELQVLRDPSTNCVVIYES